MLLINVYYVCFILYNKIYLTFMFKSSKTQQSPLENVSTFILKILFIYHVRFAAPSKHLIQLRFPKHIRTIPFNLLAIVPGEMLNTFAAK